MRPLMTSLAVVLAAVSCADGGEAADPYRWLEVVNSTDTMNWVHQQNARTLAAVGDPVDSPLFPKILELVQSEAKIPSVSVRGEHIYNLWQDEQRPRGIWRRTSLESFRGTLPAWELVLDLDSLADAEGESWVWGGCLTLSLGPSEPEDLCLMKLSRGGADASVVREFNLTSKKFVPAPFGFTVPEAKTRVGYESRDVVLIGADCGSGSFTNSGYPRTVRRWHRGTDLCSSPVVFEGAASDVSVGAWRSRDWRGYSYDWRSRATSFYDSVYLLRVGDSSPFVRLQVPSTAGVSTFADQLVLTVRSDFVVGPSLTLRSGTIAATSATAFLAGGHGSNWTILFEPSANQSCSGFVETRDYLVLKILDAVKVRLVSWKYLGSGQWSSTHTPLFSATVAVSAFHPTSNAVWIERESFLQPPVLALATSAADLGNAEDLKVVPPAFDASGLEVSQRWATSKDGTQVPYFLVSRTDEPSDQPTILYGYGGFEISLLPHYSKTLGAAWLENGGAYALANIRGGGEFGPEWHKVATREGKHKSYEDFAAVAEHLVQSGVTSAGKLAAMGGSNGGLLVGNMLVQYPQLFGAIHCSVPLLDMQRYTKLLAGASWVAEYGDPDNASDWAFLRQSSPYHNVDPKQTYPSVLFTTSTRDDRVHPAHARKMAARMQAEVPHSESRTLFYETAEGGHGGGLLREVAAGLTLKYTFLANVLGLNITTGASTSTHRATAPTRRRLDAVFV